MKIIAEFVNSEDSGVDAYNGLPHLNLALKRKDLLQEGQIVFFKRRFCLADLHSQRNEKGSHRHWKILLANTVDAGAKDIL